MPVAIAKSSMADTRTTSEQELPEHLGGHFGNTNMDTATLDYLIERYGVKTMIDVGCGPGGMVKAARERGLMVFGIDGDYHVRRFGEWIYAHDYTKGPFFCFKTDLIWSTEFVEHVEAQYQDNYLATFDTGRVLFLTAAPPGFPGWHHVNCQEQDYWIDLLTARGWTLDDEATAWVRSNGAHIFTQRQGLVFVKSDPSSLQP